MSLEHLPPAERIAALKARAKAPEPPWYYMHAADARWLIDQLEAAQARVAELEKEHHPLMMLEQLPDGTFKVTRVEEKP